MTRNIILSALRSTKELTVFNSPLAQQSLFLRNEPHADHDYHSTSINAVNVSVYPP